MKLVNVIYLFAITTLIIATKCHAMEIITKAPIHNMRQSMRKPTNSATIRQVNMSTICQNRTAEDLVKNDKDCTKFFVCINNETIVEGVCPNNMYYNDKIKLCDIAANTICENSNSNDILNNVDMNFEIANATAYCITKAEVPNQITFVGSSKRCNQYYICYHERALLQECSENLHWNSFIGKCDKPENADCTLNNINGNGNANQNNGNNGITEMTASQTTTILPLLSTSLAAANSNLINCPKDGEHIFPHMQNCDLFIYCYRGIVILQQCPFYHHFDILSRSCQWRTKGLCVRDVALNGA